MIGNTFYSAVPVGSDSHVRAMCLLNYCGGVPVCGSTVNSLQTQRCGFDFVCVEIVRKMFYEREIFRIKANALELKFSFE